VRIARSRRPRFGIFRSHVEYHPRIAPQAKKAVLADLKGPGKVASFYTTSVSEPVLKLLWNDETEPSIQVPLRDIACCR
jgi:hypothetical protein